MYGSLISSKAWKGSYISLIYQIELTEVQYSPKWYNKPPKLISKSKTCRHKASQCEVCFTHHASRKPSRWRVLSSILCSRTWLTSWKTSDLYLSNKKSIKNLIEPFSRKLALKIACMNYICNHCTNSQRKYSRTSMTIQCLHYMQ